MNDRARVPFALVGVLLLVGATGVNATLGGIEPPTDPDTERALDQATTAARTALEGAVVEAGRTAAATPVIAPAKTPAGELVDGTDPFREYLRLLVYRHASDRLAMVSERAGSVTATVSLSPARSIDALDAAKERVHLSRTGPNGTALRAHIENVTVTIRRDGDVVDRFAWNATIVAPTPVLAVHDRVSRFEKRLDAAPFEAGLGQRLTARLYAIAWARGYAQYGGGPIANVVANRHVGLATNGAVLALQESTLGTSDPTAHQAARTQALAVAKQDLLAGAGVDTRLAKAAFGAASGDTANLTRDSRPLIVRVGATADAAFASVLDQGRVAAAVREAYTAEARLAARVERVGTSRTGTRTLPGEWALVDSRVESGTAVRPGRASPPRAPGDWHVLRTDGRLVERTRITVRRWRQGNRTRATRSIRTTTHRVSIAVLGRHAAVRAPERPVRPIHRAGTGALSGPNFADVRDRAVATLVTAQGGPDALAERAAAGSLSMAPQNVAAARPSALREWVYRDLVTLRERIRNVSVRVDRGAVGTFTVNPPAELAAAIERDRAALLAAPTSYDGVADRARIAARSAYLDAVVTALEARSAKYRKRRAGVAGVLARNGGVSIDHLDRIRQARHAVRTNNPPAAGLGGPLDLTVRGSPAALSLRAGQPSLAARNSNYFTVPYADTADTVVGAMFGPRRVRLRTAALTLRTANQVATDTGESLHHRAALRRSVRRATGAVGHRLQRTLRKANIGDGPRDRQAIVTTGVTRWNTTVGRALAVSNGSAVPEIVRVATDRYPAALETQRERDQLALRLRQSLRAALQSTRVRPPQTPTNRTTDAIRTAVRGELTRELGNASDAARKRWGGKILGSVAAGLPLAPVPGYWYATTNVWQVDVRGVYERFVVRTARGVPTRGGPGGLAYVRDGSAVRFDIDGDGAPERLGRARRVAFETTTAVVVVVPPGGRGVGDTDGNADERSAGWETM